MLSDYELQMQQRQEQEERAHSDYLEEQRYHEEMHEQMHEQMRLDMVHEITFKRELIIEIFRDEAVVDEEEEFDWLPF